MEENQNSEQNEVVKPTKMEKLKAKLHPLLKVVELIKKLLKIALVGALVIAAFLVGARMHDVGFLAGKFGKDLKGATVFLSGKCSVNGRDRLPAFGNDSVKIISVTASKIEGVVIKTREYIVCNTADITTDMIPLLKDLNSTPESFPELTAAIQAPEADPEYKKLEKKTLLISGTCVTLNDETIPTFTDERVDVTEIAPNPENPKTFRLAGIKRSDKQAIKCDSSAIKYDVAGKEVEVQAPEKLTYMNKMVVVTGKCFPEKGLRDPNNKKLLGAFTLANSKLQVIQEEFNDEGKIQKVIAIALEKEWRGKSLTCDQAKYPFTLIEYNADEQILDSGMGFEPSSGEVVKPAPSIQKKAVEKAEVAPEATDISVKGTEVLSIDELGKEIQ